MIESIAALSMSMAAANLQQSYYLALTKEVMDTQEIAAQGLLEMLPTQPGGSAPTAILGDFIDTYA